MKTIIAVFLALALWSIPTAAYASCSGFIDCLFGMTERTEVRQAEMTERERINAERDAEIARIEAEAAERVRQADIEVERVRQQQYQSAAQRDIAIAQAEQQAEQYRAMIAGLTAEKVAGIQSNADSQIAALQAQAEIAIAGITETGATVRYRVAGGWTFAVVAVILAALTVLALIRRQPQQTVVLMADPRQYRQLENQTKVIEVQHAKRYIGQS